MKISGKKPVRDQDRIAVLVMPDPGQFSQLQKYIKWAAFAYHQPGDAPDGKRVDDEFRHVSPSSSIPDLK